MNRACSYLSSEHELNRVASSSCHGVRSEGQSIVGSNDDLMSSRKGSWEESNDRRLSEMHLESLV
jgi:hypothetical protein